MTPAQLLVLALAIKNETVENANSSTRIGTLFQEIINYLEGNAIDVSAEISAAVAALVNGSPAQLDTLKELSAALNNDANFASTIISQIDSEAQARTASDNTLQANITAEAQARIAADNTLQANITAEAQARASADNTLQTNITAEAQARIAACNTLQANMNTETGAREAADNVILAELAIIVQNISSVEESLSAADTTLQANITAEAQARTAADNTLQANITAETQARITAGNTLQANIYKKQTGGKRTLIKADFNAGLVGYTKLIDELDNSSGIEYEADGYYNLTFQSAHNGYFLFKQLSCGGAGALHVVYDSLFVDQNTKVTFHFEDNSVNFVFAPGEMIIDVEFIPL